MIITMTPLRISFLGGGTDYPEYFSTHGGATLATTINKYVYLTVSPLTHFFDHRIRVSYAKTELCREVSEIQHPSVRESLKYLGIDGGVEIAVVSDLPARTGLGSSSSFTVGLLNALHAWRGQFVTRAQLAKEAVYVERERIKERVGFQDQYLAAQGGFLHLQFSGNDQVVSQPVPLSSARLEALQGRLLMFYTGLQRTAHEVLSEQLARTEQGKLTSELQTLRALVDQGLQLLLSDRDLDQFGELLHQGWLLKRQFSASTSNQLVDESYAAARKAGAIGGKLLGAGAGGFLLLYVPTAAQHAVRTALASLREVPFQFENTGSQVIFYRPH